MCQDGIINLLKPAGITSHDGVSFLRRLTGIKRIGHTGTLDPMAVGVLPLCIGGATRIAEYMDLDYKRYRCEMQLGLETDTLDIWGQTIRDYRKEEIDYLKRKNITERSIVKALENFQGNITQYPPKYSAIQVKGKRLYEYAREGIEVEIKSRRVEIKEIQLIKYDKAKGVVLFDVECSKGTYIRSLCHDLGQALDTAGAMSMLIRTATGPFTLENAVTLEQLASCKDEEQRVNLPKLNPMMFPVDFPLIYFGKIIVDQGMGQWFVNGGHLFRDKISIISDPEKKHYYSVYTDRGQFLGVAEYSNRYKQLVAHKVFAREVL